MAESAEEAQKANDKSLASFDQINKLGGGDEDKPATSDSAATVSLSTDTGPAQKAMSAFEQKVHDMVGGLKEAFAEKNRSAGEELCYSGKQFRQKL
jgi:hypothetical protein